MMYVRLREFCNVNQLEMQSRGTKIPKFNEWHINMVPHPQQASQGNHLFLMRLSATKLEVRWQKAWQYHPPFLAKNIYLNTSS